MFSVITANSHYSESLRDQGTLDILGDSDIVMLQEVLKISEDEIVSRLGSVGLRLAAHNMEAGLAIAISDRFETIEATYFKHSNGANKYSDRLRGRGMITAKLESSNGDIIYAATAHPIVCVRAIARYNQIRAIGDNIVDSYPEGKFILGADMNHYPGPDKIDRDTASRAGLLSISDDSPTCLLSNTRHSWLKKIGLPDARLDTMLYRDLYEIESKTTQIASDHLAIEAKFDTH